MELRQLAAFTAVADRLHFGQAAEDLGVAQPAVSQLVRRLEDTLGTTLFERSSHRVTLTSAGAALLPHARTAVESAAHVSRLAAELATGSTGVLRIATTPGIGPRLGAAIGAFSAEHPDVALELPVLTTRQLLERLATGELDVALLRSTPPADATLRSEVVWQERYVTVLPAAHPAAAQDPADLSTLAELPMLIVARDAQPAMHDELLAVCAAVGVEPRLGPSVRTTQDTIAMVAAGAAWTLYIEGNLPADVPGVAIRRLPPPDPPSNVWAVWRPVGTNPQAQAFVASLLKRAPNPVPREPTPSKNTQSAEPRTTTNTGIPQVDRPTGHPLQVAGGQ
jgi:DNA-binding transcriptional LysR family regulator